MIGVMNFTNNPNFNHVRNGNLDFFNRRTTLTFASGTNYIADRFSANLNGPTAKSLTVNQASVLPTTLVPATNSLQVINNTVIASLASTDALQPYIHNFEGQMVRHMNQGYISIGFWLNSSFSGSLSVNVRDGSASNSYVTMLNVVTGYDYYAVYVPLNSIVIPSTTASGFTIGIGAIGGTSVQTATLNQWVVGNFISHSSQTNWASSTGSKFYLSQIQVRQGIIPKEEMKRTFSLNGGTLEGELLACQRYFARLDFGQGTPITDYYSNAANTIYVTSCFELPTPMRVNPTVTDTANWQSGNWESAISFGANSNRQVRFVNRQNAAGRSFLFANNSATSSVLCDAEY